MDIVSIRKIKKASSQYVGVFIGAFALVSAGIYGYSHGMFSSQTSVQNIVASSGNQVFSVYANGISGLNKGTLISSGNGKDTQYSIILHTADLTGASDLKFNMTTLQYLPNGASVDKNIIQAHTLKVPFSSDYNLHDTSNLAHILFDAQSSTIAGQKSSAQETYAGTTPVVVPVDIKINPYSWNMSDTIELQDVGSSVTQTLDFGLANPVKLILKH